MDRIEELNIKNGDVLQPYRKLSKKKTAIINNHLGYFLSIGLAYMVAGFSLGVQTEGGTMSSDSNILFSLIVGLISLAVLIGLTSWTLSLYRSVIEKTANKDLTLTRSSFIPDFGENFFKRGIKFTLSTMIVGFSIGIVVGLALGLTLPLLVGGLAFGGGVLTESVAVGILGFLIGFMAVLAIGAVIGIIISPFLLPLTTLFVFYGDDIGVFEAIKLSFSLGKNNYGKLLKASIKISLVNLLGLLAFGIGIIYTSVWGILIEVDAVSSILGVSLKDGKTFKGTYNDIPTEPELEPTTTEEKGYTLEEVYDVGENRKVVEDEVIVTEEAPEVEINEEANVEEELLEEEILEEELIEVPEEGIDYDETEVIAVVEPEEEVEVETLGDTEDKETK